MRKFGHNPIGERYGSLVVLREATVKELAKLHLIRRGRWFYLKCDCGKIKSFSYRRYENRKTCQWSCTVGKKFRKRGLKYHESGFAGKLKAYRAHKNSKDWYKSRGKKFPVRKAFKLTFDQFVSIVSKPCTYCGRLWSKVTGEHKYKGLVQKHGRFEHNGIDRIDSLKGYVLGNCAPCCTDCNRAKSSMTQTEFKMWLTRAYNFYCAGVQVDA